MDAPEGLPDETVSDTYSRHLLASLVERRQGVTLVTEADREAPCSCGRLHSVRGRKPKAFAQLLRPYLLAEALPPGWPWVSPPALTPRPPVWRNAVWHGPCGRCTPGWLMTLARTPTPSPRSSPTPCSSRGRPRDPRPPPSPSSRGALTVAGWGDGGSARRAHRWHCHGPGPPNSNSNPNPNPNPPNMQFPIPLQLPGSGRRRGGPAPLILHVSYIFS
jgi:hypothetical protein